MKIKYILLIFLTFTAVIDAQRLLKISVSVNGSTEYVPYLVRKGTTFVSARELAKLITENYYYNNEASKLELKFRSYNLKVTARNQFVVLISRTDNSQH